MTLSSIRSPRQLVRVGGAALALLLLALAAPHAHPAPATTHALAAPSAPRAGYNPSAQPTTRTFTLVAAPGRLTIRHGQTVPVWTYNGTVPGPELRVQQGDRVRVTLVNHLPQATTIHWHGLIAPNGNDGVAGVTQNAVLPGHSYTYDFVARDPGTYWYHPHQKSAQEVDKGLYGALIVSPRQSTAPAPLDRTLVLDDWPLAPPGGRPGMSGMSGMGASEGATDTSATQPPAALRPYVADSGMGAYRTFTVNGRAYPDTAPIQAPAGTWVRLRLVNAGYLTHILHLHGATYRLVAVDGTDVHDPQPTGDLLPIAAGQRMDVLFRMPRGIWSLHDHSGLLGADEMRVLLGQGTRPSVSDAREMRATDPPLLDLARYGRPAPTSIGARSRVERTFRLVIGQKAGAMDGTGSMGNMSGQPGTAGMGMDTTYTLNGRTFPRLAPLVVERGQRVEIAFVNRSAVAHPMHLHGHRMQVLTLNGEAVTGAPLYQDTVLVLPGTTTVVAVRADNPGTWMLHCHELHHAASGLDTLLQYKDVPRRFALGGGLHPIYRTSANSHSCLEEE